MNCELEKVKTISVPTERTSTDIISGDTVPLRSTVHGKSSVIQQ
jgi:hypothetical protein